MSVMLSPASNKAVLACTMSLSVRQKAPKATTRVGNSTPQALNPVHVATTKGSSSPAASTVVLQSIITCLRPSVLLSPCCDVVVGGRQWGEVLEVVQDVMGPGRDEAGTADGSGGVDGPQRSASRLHLSGTLQIGPFYSGSAEFSIGSRYSQKRGSLYAHT